MNRVTDYIRFTVGFIGLGYIALWPLTAHDSGIAALQAAYVCGVLPLDAFCRAAPGFQNGLPLSPGLHVLGSLAVACMSTHLSLRLLRRVRRRRAASLDAAPGPAAPTPDRAPRPVARPPLRPVKPRTHFGLRGLPH